MGDVIETNQDQHEVAVALAPNSEEVLDLLALSEPAKKKRKTGIQLSEAKIITAKAKLSRLEVKLTEAKAATGYGATAEVRREKLQQLSDQIKAQQLAIGTLQKNMDDAIALADAKAQVAREKEEKAALEAEIKVASGDACLVAIVDCKMSQDKHFDGKVEKNEKVWKEKVYPKFMRLIDNGDLSSTDKMSCDAMQSKYSSELAHFRKYAKDVHRYKQSGASADDVDGIPKRATTEIFLKYNYGSRPMSVAPFSINGGSVESGGVASAFGRASPVSDDDEVAGMLAGVGAHVEPAVGPPPAADPFVMVGEIGSGAPELRASFTPLLPAVRTTFTPSPVLAAPSTAISTNGAAPTRRRGRDVGGQLPAPADPMMLMMMQMMQTQQQAAAAQAKRSEELFSLFLGKITDKYAEE